MGTGQLMPGTASFISGTLIGMPLDIHSVSDNIRMSAAFLAYLAGVEGNNRCATIAAYYEGPLNLSHYGVFTETQAYVASVEALHTSLRMAGGLDPDGPDESGRIFFWLVDLHRRAKALVSGLLLRLTGPRRRAASWRSKIGRLPMGFGHFEGRGGQQTK